MLPFPPKSFDLVRMANLTLAVPRDRWTHLLEEVKRVLRPGGVLEIIDDELFFPDIQPSPNAPLTRTRSLREPRRPCFDDSRIHHQNTDTGVWKPLPPCPPLAPASFRRNRAQYHQDVHRSPLADFAVKVSMTQTMEAVFRKMLSEQYNVSLSPHELLEPAIVRVFGSFSSQTKELAVPTRDALPKKMKVEDSHYEILPERTAHISRRHGGRHSLDNVATDFDGPASIAPKAMRLLQAQGEPRSRRPYQPPGCMVLPSMFIPCEPEVLEMHACRNIHIVIACKNSLAEFVAQHQDDTGKPFVTEEEFEELMFDYEKYVLDFESLPLLS